MADYLRTLTKHVARAKRIQKSLGTRVAAGFLRNRGVGLCLALHYLVGRGQ